MSILRWLVAALLISDTLAVGWDVETDLDRYVNYDDGYFSWELIGEIRYDRFNVTVYLINMTSQKWQDESLVDHPIWWHNVGIGVPDELEFTNTAFMWVGETSNDWDDPQPEGNFSLYNLAAAELVNATRCIGAYTLQIPNQGLKFTNHPDPTDDLKEDTLIAWTWRTFLDMEDPPDPTIPMRMPMTKAAKRGLDTISEFADQYLGLSINEFMPFGASKRGWTVWSLAAVDRRVKLAIPIVFSMLNMPKVLTNHFQMLDGQWSFALEPYYEVNVTAEIYANRTQELYLIEDMFNYKERFTMPTIMISATGDEFFMCTDSHVWWNEMPDPKYVIYVENTEHILFPEYPEIFDTIIGSFLTYLRNETFPSFTWIRSEIEGGSYIEAFTDPPPEEIVVMRAETLKNDTRRDFRLFAGYPDIKFHPVIWRNVTELLEERGDGHYYVEMENVEGEWVGFYIFGYWRGPNNRRIFLSTEIQVTPDTFPAPLCTEDPDCYGNLI